MNKMKELMKERKEITKIDWAQPCSQGVTFERLQKTLGGGLNRYVRRGRG